MCEDERMDAVRYALEEAIAEHIREVGEEHDLSDLPTENVARTLLGGLTRRGLLEPQASGAQIVQYHEGATRYFIDTEFYENGSTIDLISLGCVCSDGRTFYAVSQDADLSRVSHWVRQHVLPQLPPYGDKAWMHRESIARDFAIFVRPGALSEFWGYYADYDWVAICQMYGTMMGLPKHFPRYCMDLKQLSWLVGNPAHPPQPKDEHHALADALWNRDLYAYLRTVPSGVWGYKREDKS
jgi:hypothetical protein